MPVVNPVLIQDQLSEDIYPQPIVSETFILRRDSVSLDLQSVLHGKLKGSGSLFLTNMRIVIHCSQKSSQRDFVAYQIGLGEVVNPKFEQPIFGANYLKGQTKPQQVGQLGDSWRITFSNGGCCTLLPVLHSLLTAGAQAERSHGPNAIQPGGMPVYQAIPTNVGYIDPNDPSVVYVHQPKPAEVYRAPAE